MIRARVGIVKTLNFATDRVRTGTPLARFHAESDASMEYAAESLVSVRANGTG
jgi:hypothetical protein